MTLPDRMGDESARAQAIEPGSSCIVQAPAGSGKTALLVQRFLALLAVAEAPEEIAAITFTKKAAAEMRGRILAALRSAGGPEPDNGHERATRRLALAALEQDGRKGWHLRDHPNRLRVQTLDAFGLSLARRMPWLSRLGGQPAPLEDAAPLYAAAARSTLALLDTGHPAAAHAARVLRHLDNQSGRAEDLLAGMLGRRDQWLRHVASGTRAPGTRALGNGASGTLAPGTRAPGDHAPGDRAPGNRAPGNHAPGDHAALRASLEAALAAVVREALAHASDGLMPVAAQLVPLAAHAGRTLAQSNPEAAPAACAGLTALPEPRPERLPQWLGLVGLLLTGGGGWRKPGGINVKLGFPPADKAAKARMGALLERLSGDAALAERLDMLRRLPAVRYTDAQWELMEALLALLPLAADRLRTEFQRAGSVDFIEIALAARQVAGDADTDGAVDDSLRHLLVDEFQDTSNSQFHLLERITAGWTGRDGRTLFLVGDPMQSIYRFREAEVGLFLRARMQGIGALALRPLTLRSNFRSDGGIVAWVNGAFAEAMAAPSDALTGAVAYSESEAARPAAPQPAVTVHPLLLGRDQDADQDADEDAGTDVGTVREREAELVAALAAEALAAGALRDRPGESVAILVRARSHLEAILPALRRHGVPYLAVDIDKLGDQPAVLDLLALTQALLHPAHRVAWLAVLRGPACGLSLADLLALAGEDTGATLWERIQDDAVAARLSPDGRRRIGRVRPVLAEALARRARAGLREWVQDAWLELGGPACLSPVELAHADALLAVLDALDAEGAEPTPEELARRVEGLFAAPPRNAAAAPAVQVMTLHKAKGLEFGTVILPGLERSTRGEEARLLRWLERPGGGEADLLLAPIHETGSEGDPTYAYLGEIEQRRAGHETRRLMYVAATRARQRLHLIGTARTDGKGGVKAPGRRSLLAVVWPAVAEDFQDAAEAPPLAQPSRMAQAPNAAAPAEPRVAPLARLPADWSPPAQAAAPPGAATPPPEREDAAPIEYSWAGFAARQVGTAVHRLLLRIAKDGAEAWPPERVEAQRPALHAALAQLGVPDAELDPAAERAVAALRGALGDERGRWVLSPHAQDRSEYALAAVLDGEVRRLRVDRTFVDSQGLRWIVDYKTGVHQGGDPEGFLAREVERYREQMERYARVLRALEPERPIRLALYFPLIPGGWREWEAQ